MADEPNYITHVLHMYNVTLLKGVGGKVADLSNLGKQYFA